MGFQYVGITLHTGEKIDGLVVLNGEELIIPKDFLHQIKDIFITEKKEK